MKKAYPPALAQSFSHTPLSHTRHGTDGCR
jgi:hypothetical protein